MKLVISPSKLEQFRAYYNEEYNGKIQLEDIIKYLKGEVEWKAEMNYGSAIHAVLEFGFERYLQPDGKTCIIKEDDFPESITLTTEQLKPVIDYRARNSRIIHEIPVKKTIYLKGYEILLNMRVDGMRGHAIHEHKNPKDSSFITYDNYEKSAQWKLYLMATEALYVQYNIFKWKQLKNKPLEITYVPFRYHRYPGLEQDVNYLIEHFLTFCEQQDLIDLLKSKFDN